MKRLRRWHAIPVAFALLALAGALFAAAQLAPPSVPGQKGTLSGVASCTSGSLYLGRFDCRGSSCDDTPAESVFLMWNEREVTVRLARKAFPIVRREGLERPIPRVLLPRLLAEFAALPRGPADPTWVSNTRLRDMFEAGGECDDDSISAGLSARRLNLVETLKSAPAGDAAQVLMLWGRGPGPRADRLFSRLEKLTRVAR